MQLSAGVVGPTAMPPKAIIREMDAYAPPDGLSPKDLVHIKVGPHNHPSLHASHCTIV